MMPDEEADPVKMGKISPPYGVSVIRNSINAPLKILIG